MTLLHRTKLSFISFPELVISAIRHFTPKIYAFSLTIYDFINSKTCFKYSSSATVSTSGPNIRLIVMSIRVKSESIIKKAWTTISRKYSIHNLETSLCTRHQRYRENWRMPWATLIGELSISCRSPRTKTKSRELLEKKKLNPKSNNFVFLNKLFWTYTAYVMVRFT